MNLAMMCRHIWSGTESTFYCIYWIAGIFIWINAPVTNPRNKLSETEIAAYANKTKMYLIINSITAAIITDYTCAPFWEETNFAGWDFIRNSLYCNGYDIRKSEI